MTEKIAVLGAGSWGSILAGVLDENKNLIQKFFLIKNANKGL